MIFVRLDKLDKIAVVSRSKCETAAILSNLTKIMISSH